MTDKASYRVLALGLDYPSVTDGKRRFRKTGDIIDDLPPNEIKRLVKEKAIEKAEGTGDVAVGAQAAEAASVIPEEG